MNEVSEISLRVLTIGVGATMVQDLWSELLKRVLGVVPLNWAMVGRWVGHFPSGRFVHESIAKAAPVPGERPLGWLTHYAIGVGFAALLLGLTGLDWARQPTPLPAIMVGVATVLAPFLIMQPAFGMGVAASRTPAPAIARLRSLLNHTVFGVGLYLAALLTARLLP
ncbi:DUF2938 domain-containing protein [Pseudoduganella violacea]|uniref:DUF2938 family protein n=1 Tax=Pseudoduganella violacea TaxID=1715466 RepID=A0A7W5FVE1_9BURK|nr:DUF2938 domain-containing protein [Pseudoduganella violacea]MBB3120905.1 hypothetical protein [Pseudoduganella violacea]